MLLVFILSIGRKFSGNGIIVGAERSQLFSQVSEQEKIEGDEP